MKRNLFVGLAVTAAIVAAAGCSTDNQGASTTTSVSATAMPSQSQSATEPSHPVTYSPQVELPFGDSINHLAGVAVDTTSNVYVLDLYYGQVWMQAPGASHLTKLPFTELGRPVDVAVDAEGNLYVVDNLRTGF
jgi:glucose/arabinose dehydrogenase